VSVKICKKYIRLQKVPREHYLCVLTWR